jgi:DNA-directed RNA polymerase subunit RPC12/RpoP
MQALSAPSASVVINHAVLTACSICTKEFDSEDLHRCPHCEGMTCEACDYQCLCHPRTNLLRAAGARGLYVLTLMEEVAALNAAALIQPLEKSQIQRLKAITVTIDRSKKFFSQCAKLAV